VTDLHAASDAYLAGSIANGDAEAVRPLIERYRKPLAALLNRALGASPDVDDLFQETWIRVVRSAHRYDPEQRFSSWLFAIAWNLVKDRWSRRVDVADVDLATMPAATQSAEDAAMERDRAEKLRALVARLPERLAQALLLRYFEELSEKEMAARLGIPIGTVKSRIHHGLKQLAKESHELQ
jgi:RNA polymerase sigma-70 factor (ECF subfamily)